MILFVTFNLLLPLLVLMTVSKESHVEVGRSLEVSVVPETDPEWTETRTVNRARWENRVTRREENTGSGLGYEWYPRHESDVDPTHTVVDEGGTLCRSGVFSLYGRWRLGVPHNTENVPLSVQDSEVLDNVEREEGHRTSYRLPSYNVETEPLRVTDLGVFSSLKK